MSGITSNIYLDGFIRTGDLSIVTWTWQYLFVFMVVGWNIATIYEQDTNV